MPSQRRMRLLLYVVLAGVVTLLFFTSRQREFREMDPRTLQDFYHKTMGAMNDRSSSGGGGAVDDPEAEKLAKEMTERLKEAEQKAKDLANAKAPNKPDDPVKIVGVGSSAGGQKKIGSVSDEGGESETAEDHEAEEVLDEMLQKSPVLIFSKSYCPHSKKAKGILLEKYSIDPAPYVVELDLHPLGPKIQDRLEILTGRRTVPNIMVHGKSIGGGDEISALHNQNELAETIKTYGGKSVTVRVS